MLLLCLSNNERGEWGAKNMLEEKAGVEGCQEIDIKVHKANLGNLPETLAFLRIRIDLSQNILFLLRRNR